MAAAWVQLAVMAAFCLAGAQAKTNPVKVQLLKLEVRAATLLDLD
jgi:hypothetical protein